MLNSKMRLSLFIKYIAPGLSKKKPSKRSKQNKTPQKTKNKSTTPVLFYFEGGFNTQ